MASHYITSIFISELRLNLFKQWKNFIHQIVTKLFNHRLIKLKHKLNDQGKHKEAAALNAKIYKHKKKH